MGDSFSAFGDGNGFSVLGQGNSYVDAGAVVVFQDTAGTVSSASGVTAGDGTKIIKPLSLENACKIWWSLNTFGATVEMDDSGFGTDNFNSELPSYTTTAGLTRATTVCSDRQTTRTVNKTITGQTGTYTFTADLRTPHGNGSSSFIFFYEGDFQVTGYGWNFLIQLQANISKSSTSGPPQSGICTETRFYTNSHQTLSSGEVLTDVTINGVDFIEVKTVVGPSGALQSSNPFTISLDSLDIETYS